MISVDDAALKVLQECGCDPFVHENAAVLRIVPKLDVEAAIGPFRKVGLRAAAHFADQASCINGHERSEECSNLKFARRSRNRINLE